MKLNICELETIKQWYNAIYELNRDYIKPSDAILYIKIGKALERPKEVQRWNLCCNCKEWRGSRADEFDKCHINKIGHVRFDNYCIEHSIDAGIDVDRFISQFEFKPMEIEFSVRSK